MRVGLVVNDIKTEEAGYTTSRLAVDLINSGHEAWTLSIEDFSYEVDEHIYAYARTVKKKQFKTTATYIEEAAG